MALGLKRVPKAKMILKGHRQFHFAIDHTLAPFCVLSRSYYNVVYMQKNP